jgi:hypothetical protein
MFSSSIKDGNIEGATLTPCIPLSLKGEGEGFLKEGFHPS